MKTVKLKKTSEKIDILLCLCGLFRFFLTIFSTKCPFLLKNKIFWYEIYRISELVFCNIKIRRNFCCTVRVFSYVDCFDLRRVASVSGLCGSDFWVRVWLFFDNRWAPGLDWVLFVFGASSVALAAFLDGGPTCTTALQLRAGITHAHLGSHFIHHTPHNIGESKLPLVRLL